MGVRAETSQAKKATRILCAQGGDFIMSLYVIPCSRVRLYDGGVDSTLVHPPDHLLFSAVQAENAAFSKMGVSINYFGHSVSPRKFVPDLSVTLTVQY
jgi:hypothetical protein